MDRLSWGRCGAAVRQVVQNFGSSQQPRPERVGRLCTSLSTARFASWDRPRSAPRPPLAAEDQKRKRFVFLHAQRLEKEASGELVPLPVRPIQHGHSGIGQRGEIAIDGAPADLADLGKLLALGHRSVWSKMINWISRASG